MLNSQVIGFICLFSFFDVNKLCKREWWAISLTM